MSRSSPGVRRVAAILNFVADHPGQAFALTDLVRALKLSRATCHALLTGLVDVGYLYRTSDKTYVLGPALAAIGRTAADHFSPLQIAHPEMRAIADEFDVVCGAYFLDGDTLHLRDRAAAASHVGYPVPLGTRMPLRSVQAGVFFARAPRDLEAWLARTAPPPAPDRIATLREATAFVESHGYLALARKPGVELAGPADPQAITARTGTDDLPVTQLLDCDDGQHYPLAAIMAPVFDHRDKVSFALVMAGFHTAMSGAQVRAAGARLTEACARISAFVSGKAIPPAA